MGYLSGNPLERFTGGISGGVTGVANAGDQFTQNKWSQPERGGLQHAVLQDEQNVYDNGPWATKLMVALGLLWGGGAAGASALGGGAAGGGTASAVTPEAVAGVAGQGEGTAAAGASSTPYWQQLLRNQAISRGIGLLSSNGNQGGGGNNDVYTPSSGFYGNQPTTQPQQPQPTTQPTLASQNQASNQQLGMGGLLQRRNPSGYGRAYG